MKKQLIILLGFILSIQAFSQSTDQNWVKTTIYKKDAAHITDADKAITITYYDGLGRPIQVINHKQSATDKDIVQHIEYDDLGRQKKEYLPYSRTASLLFDEETTVLGDLSIFYDGSHGYESTDFPYSEKDFEPSPLNRVLRQSAPGDDWALGEGHEIKFDYQANTTNDNVKLFEFSTDYDSNTKIYEPSSLQQTDTYVENQLYKNITVDENNLVDTNNQTEEFTDKQGKVVLKRIKTSTENFDTYYVYDDYGNLTFVIPPKASDLVSNGSILDDTPMLNNLCYQYKYDYRNRLVAKKIPNKHWEYIVYDKLDRVRATGPVLSPFKDTAGQTGWLYTKYDVFDRPILTAWKQGTVSESMRISIEVNFVNNYSELSESRGNTSGLELPLPYTNLSFPNESTYHILTINYYDDYDFGLETDNPDPPTQILGYDVRDATNGNCKTLVTGSWVRILEDSNQIDGNLSYIFYKTDRLVSPIYTNIQYPNGGYTSTSSEIDFEGKVLKTITEHKRTINDNVLTTEENYDYSTQGRLLSVTHKVNSEGVENIVTNHYKELGELEAKDVGGTVSSPLQTVGYTYNIRGWLTAINDVENIGDDLFAFKINYNYPNSPISLYNGNISETYWKTNSDNIERKYSYDYDKLNRLTNAHYKNVTNDIVNTYNENLTYDKNGNIQTLNRNGGFESSTSAAAIDNLSYYYDNNSNQLEKVVDLSNSSQGFKDDSNGSVATDLENDYDYDTAGNMIKDQNKNITNIKYNHLNLPIEIDFTSNRKIFYTYDATGIKLKKVTENGANIITTDYLNGYQYENKLVAYGGRGYAKLNFFPTSEGYVNAVYRDDISYTEPLRYDYVYNYTDHLGNIRVSYTKYKDGVKVLEETNYYPFGLKHGNYNASKSKISSKSATNEKMLIPTNVNVYKYKYNGKELQDEFGLNVYDYGARMYDPTIGRTPQLDPHAYSYPWISPYNYAFNNPVLVVDPTGKDGVVTGSGTKKDPYVVKANYYYHGLSKKQAKGLRAAASAYNNGGDAHKIKDADGNKIYVQFNIGVTEAKSAEAAQELASNDYVDTEDGGAASFGNVVTVGGSSTQDHFGLATRHSVSLNQEKITNTLASNPGGNEDRLIKGTFIHEIGHNIGGSHGDTGSIMQKIGINPNVPRNTIGGGGDGTFNYSYPSVSKHGIRAIMGRVNMSPGSINSRYLSDKENKRVNEATKPGSSGKLTTIK